MYRYFFTAFFLTLGFYACSQKTYTITRQTTADSPMDIPVKGIEQSILNYVNAHRASINKPALTLINDASAEATKHSRNMANKSVAFGHDGFDNRIDVIISKIGRINAAAENVAYGQMNASTVVNGWLRSPGHKKNIEGDYNLTGIGVYKDANGTIYFTQIFLKK